MSQPHASVAKQRAQRVEKSWWSTKHGPTHRILTWDGTGLVIAFVALWTVMAFWAPHFLTKSNQLNILQQAAFFGIAALAMTLVIIAGEIDLSVGSQAALASAMLGVLVTHRGWPMWLACLAVLALAGAIGTASGLIRAVLGVPTFIITLALYISLRGLAKKVTNTFPITIDNGKFFYWGPTGKIVGGIPVPAVYLIIAFLVVALIARKTVLGRSIYAVGGNPKSARLSGINVRTVRIAVMALSALAAAVVGLLQSAQLASGNSLIAQGLELDAIAAAIIGGTALSGGKGTIFGTLIGVLLVAVLQDGMVLLGVDPNSQDIARGSVILVAVLISVFRGRKVAGLS